MDPTEEEYFNRDEEEEALAEPIPDEEPSRENLLDLKRRQLDEDGDDELNQLAQKSPKTNGTENSGID